MRSFIVLVSSLAVAACSPTLGLLADAVGGALGGGDGGAGGVLGGGSGAAVPLTSGITTIEVIPGVSVGAAIVGGIVAGVPGAIVGGVLGGAHETASPAGDKDIFQALGCFVKGIPDSVGKDKLIFEDVVNLKLPGVLQDGFVSLVVVGRADGGLVNAIFPGLGTLLGNVVIAIGKIFDCIIYPKGKDVPYLCQKDFLSKYGYNDIASCSSASEIIEFYKAKTARKEALKLMYERTKGEGVQYLPVTERIIFQRFVLLAKLAEKDYHNWTNEDFRSYAVNIIIITCTLIEKQQKGLGDQALDQYLAILKKYNENKQFPDLSCYRQEISDIINTVHKPDSNLELRALNFFVKGLTNAVSKEKNLLTDFVSLKLPGAVEDGFNTLTVVARVVGGIINNAIPGLGKVFDNLITAAGKVFACALGSSDVETQICQKDYLSKYGYNDIGSCSSVSGILEFYNIDNAKKEVQKAIDDYTKGKGVQVLSVNEKIVYDYILRIIASFDNDCRKWTDSDFKAYAVNNAVVAIVVFESMQKALGVYAFNEFVVILSKYNKNKRFPDVADVGQQIIDATKNAQLSSWNGAYSTTYPEVYKETTDGLYQAVQTFSKLLPDSLGKVKTLFEDVGNIKVLGVLDDAFNSLVVVGRADGAVANIIFPGLGDIFSNLVIAIGKIYVCVLGPNPEDHYLCQQDYLSKYGYNDIATSTNANNILDFYKVKNAKQDIQKYLNDFTRGKDGLTALERIIYERTAAVSTLIDKDYTKWNSDDLKTFTFSIVVMTCIVMESQQKGLGRGAVDDYVPGLVKYNVNNQFLDLASSKQEIYNLIDQIQPKSLNPPPKPSSDEYKKIVTESKAESASSGATSSSSSSGSGRTVTNTDGSQLSESKTQSAASATTNQASANANAKNTETISKSAQGTYSEKTADKNSASASSGTQNDSQSSGSSKTKINADGSKETSYTLKNAATSSSNQASEQKSSHASERTWSR